PSATSGLSHRPAPRLRCRQAQKSCKERNRRVRTQLCDISASSAVLPLSFLTAESAEGRREGPLLLGQRTFAAQNVVVVLGEPVGFVAHILQQPQGIRMAA